MLLNAIVALLFIPIISYAGGLIADPEQVDNKPTNYYIGLGLGNSKLNTGHHYPTFLTARVIDDTGPVNSVFVGFSMMGIGFELGIKDYKKLADLKFEGNTEQSDFSDITIGSSETVTSALTNIEFTISASDSTCRDEAEEANASYTATEIAKYSSVVPYVASKIGLEFGDTYLYMKPALSILAKENVDSAITLDKKDGASIDVNCPDTIESSGSETNDSAVMSLAVGAEYSVSSNVDLGLEYAVSNNIANAQTIALHLIYRI